MRYAFMSFSCPELTHDEMLAAAVEYGYDGIEPRAAAGHAHGVELTASPAERAAFRTRAEASGIEHCCLALSSRFADPATAQDTIVETRRYIDLAADIGAPTVRVFGGKLPQGVTRDAAIAGVSEALASLADHAAQRNVLICLETHDDWCDPTHVAAVMKNVDHPAVRVNWDVLHPLRVCSLGFATTHALLKPWIAHTHVHDSTFDADSVGSFEYVEMGTGLVDHRPVIDLLQAVGYEGYLSGEWINWEPYDVHLPREIAIMRSYG
jgi:sugar phosphate isomerase/epimerase